MTAGPIIEDPRAVDPARAPRRALARAPDRLRLLLPARDRRRRRALPRGRRGPVRVLPRARPLRGLARAGGERRRGPRPRRLARPRRSAATSASARSTQPSPTSSSSVRAPRAPAPSSSGEPGAVAGSTSSAPWPRTRGRRRSPPASSCSPPSPAATSTSTPDEARGAARRALLLLSTGGDPEPRTRPARPGGDLDGRRPAHGRPPDRARGGRQGSSACRPRGSPTSARRCTGSSTRRTSPGAPTPPGVLAQELGGRLVEGRKLERPLEGGPVVHRVAVRDDHALERQVEQLAERRQRPAARATASPRPAARRPAR